MWNRKWSAGTGTGCPKARDQTAVTWSRGGGCPGAVRAKGAQRSWADEDRPVSTAALAGKWQYFQEHSEQVSNMITWPVSGWWLISKAQCCQQHFKQVSDIITWPVSAWSLISKGQYCQVHFEQVSNMVTWAFSAWWLLSEGQYCWVHFEQASYYFWRQDSLQQVVWNKTVQGLTKVEVVCLLFNHVPDIHSGLSCCVPFIHYGFYQEIWTLFVYRIWLFWESMWNPCRSKWSGSQIKK